MVILSCLSIIFPTSFNLQKQYMCDYSAERPLNKLRPEPATFGTEGRYCVWRAGRYHFKITV